MTAAQVGLLGFAINVWAMAQIWLAQLVVYPLFARVGTEQYRAYHGFYSRRIPLPVIVPGVICFMMPVVVALAGPPVPAGLTAANLACGAIGLAVTAGLEVPRHARLERHGKDDRLIAELVRYNWPRTASITFQALIGLRILGYAGIDGA